MDLQVVKPTLICLITNKQKEKQKPLNGLLSSFVWHCSQHTHDLRDLFCLKTTFFKNNITQTAVISS